jgi:predicted kinase
MSTSTKKDGLTKSNITVIVGMSGSGKTTLANTLLDAHTVLIDDPTDITEVTDVMRSGGSCVIADPNLCFSSCQDVLRALIEKYDYKDTWIYFENDPIKCVMNNIKRNDDRNTLPSIRRHTENYFIPDGVETKRIES